MDANSSGQRVPHHRTPIERAEFFTIRQSKDPDRSFAEVCRILRMDLRNPWDALSRCSDWIDGHGVESVELPGGGELIYVNKGDTYDSTLCHVEGRAYFVSCWGDVVEESEIVEVQFESTDGADRVRILERPRQPGAAPRLPREPDTAEGKG
jgi:hypothetical protein